jgi:hypothetical protein
MGLALESIFNRIPVQVSIEALEELLGDYPRRNFQVLWDGSTWGVSPAAPVHTCSKACRSSARDVSFSQ